MRSLYQDVGDFHRKFGIPEFDPRKFCQFPSTEVMEYRLKFLREEVDELHKAWMGGNLPDALDAIADIVYVAMGTGHYFNMPFPEIWAEVQRANLERVLCKPEDCPPEKKYRTDMVVKPPGWKAPQIQQILDHQNFFARRMARVMK